VRSEFDPLLAKVIAHAPASAALAGPTPFEVVQRKLLSALRRCVPRWAVCQLSGAVCQLSGAVYQLSWPRHPTHHPRRPSRSSSTPHALGGLTLLRRLYLLIVLILAARALLTRSFQIEGIATNIPELCAILSHEKLAANTVFTSFLEDHDEDIQQAVAAERAANGGATAGGSAAAMELKRKGTRSMLQAVGAQPGAGTAMAMQGYTVDAADPLAVLDVRADAPPQSDDSKWLAPVVGQGGASEADGVVTVESVQQGQVVSISVVPEEAVAVRSSINIDASCTRLIWGAVFPARRLCVRAARLSRDDGHIQEGQPLLVLSAMKMEHVVYALPCPRG
jgi:hypothetical protein